MASQGGVAGGIDFEDVLKGVAASAAAEARYGRAPSLAPGVWRMAEGWSHVTAPARAARQAYDTGGWEPEPIKPAAADGDARSARQALSAPPPPGVEPGDVAAELGRLDGLSAAELKRLRRRFAARNHPDRVAPTWRERATRRMTLANALIDEAIAGRG